MLVNLYELDDNYSYKSKIHNISIRRILSPSIHYLEDFLLKNFGKGWVSEIKAACYKSNPTCFIAVDDNCNEIVGFAGYDATCKGFFGPLGVNEKYRGKHIAADLIYKSLLAMKEDGYAYAIIGGVEDKVKGLYEKVCNAKSIPSTKSVYSRMI